MTPEQPLPCPFCGGKAYLDLCPRHESGPDATAYYYRCLSCAATGGWGKCPGTAMHRWNMREEGIDRAVRETIERCAQLAEGLSDPRGRPVPNSRRIAALIRMHGMLEEKP